MARRGTRATMGSTKNENVREGGDQRHVTHNYSTRRFAQATRGGMESECNQIEHSSYPRAAAHCGGEVLGTTPSCVQSTPLQAAPSVPFCSYDTDDESTMGSASLPCANTGCEEPGTRACGKCHAAYYCSKECQRSHHPDHKRTCKWVERWNEKYDVLKLDEAAARELVASTARHLNDECATPDSITAADKALCQLEISAFSPENERLLGKAGVCTLLESALDRSLTGESRVPLETICRGMYILSKTSLRNANKFGKDSTIKNLTKVLIVAIRDCDWPLMDTVSNCINALTCVDRCCDMFGTAGTFEVVGQCIVVAACWGQEAEGGYSACRTLTRLGRMAKHCTHPGCQNLGRLSGLPGIYAALDELFHHTVTNLKPHCTERCPRCLCVPQDASRIALVCDAMRVVANPRIFPTDACLAMATPRVLSNLVRALEIMAPAGGDPAATPDADVCLIVCSVLENFMDVVYESKELALGQQDEIRTALRGACWPMVAILRVANRECRRSASQAQYRQLQVMAAGQMVRLLTDNSNVHPSVHAGAAEVQAETLRQAMEQGDFLLQRYARTGLSKLSIDALGVLHLATKKDLCVLMVEALKAVLALGRPAGGEDDVPLLASMAHAWGRMITAHPPCRKWFLAAGAGPALDQARELASASGNFKFADMLHQAFKRMKSPSSNGKLRNR
eukprot:jgi/Mesvir1/15296/Mv06507-RA.1